MIEFIKKNIFSLLVGLAVCFIVGAAIFGSIALLQKPAKDQTVADSPGDDIHTEASIGDLETLYGLTKDRMDDYLATTYWPKGQHELSTGITFQQRVLQTEKSSDKYGEVMYRGSCDLRAIVRAWEDSPEHRAVLDKKYPNGVLLIKPDPYYGDGYCIAIMTTKSSTANEY